MGPVLCIYKFTCDKPGVLHLSAFCSFHEVYSIYSELYCLGVSFADVQAQVFIYDIPLDKNNACDFAMSLSLIIHMLMNSIHDGMLHISLPTPLLDSHVMYNALGTHATLYPRKY